MNERQTGTVKWFNDAKGYGFIARDLQDNSESNRENQGEPQSSSDDIFVHFSAIEMQGYRTLLEGQRVEFTIEKGDKGLHATNVVVI